MVWKIPLFKIYWDEKDVKAVSSVIKRGMYWTTGADTKKFEEMLSNYVGTKYAVVFNSGTSALHAALLAHGIKNNDEVIVPSFTFIATANTVLFVGGTPVFAEVEDRTYGLDPEEVKEKITNKTRAIIPVHYGGSPCLIKDLKELADDHKLLLIEDAAEALGARVEGENVGKFGDSAMLSFCQNKVITTGDGGAVTTDSKKIYERLKLVRSHGRSETKDYFSTTEPLDYIALGYNFRMPDILGALGVSQLEKINKLIRMRRENAEYFNRKLSKIDDITLPIPPREMFHVYQMYTIRVKGGRRKRDELVAYLGERRIMSKIYFSPAIHQTQFYMNKFGYKSGDLPATERLSDEVLTLPMYPHMRDEDKRAIVEAITDFFTK